MKNTIYLFKDAKIWKDPIGLYKKYIQFLQEDGISQEGDFFKAIQKNMFITKTLGASKLDKILKKFAVMIGREDEKQQFTSKTIRRSSATIAVEKLNVEELRQAGNWKSEKLLRNTFRFLETTKKN